LAHTGTVIEGQLPNNTTGHADDFTSRHPGGVNFLFADASVRFIHNNINEWTWVALGTRAAGEPASEN
jgi:prepilin-type processing-associated H-X9-DG protein